MIWQSVAVLLLAALIPPGIVLAIVYRMDQREREPARMLLGLFFRGVLAMVPILLLEIVATELVDGFTWSSWAYLFLSYFVIPGFIEEGVKYKVLKRSCWNSPWFNDQFDAVVYGVFVSLGFAAVENVLYVIQSGLAVAISRALFSIPGHALFGVVMGIYLGRAKWMNCHNQEQQARGTFKLAFLIPAVLHGLYDFILMGFGALFYVYFILLLIFAIRALRRAAREDRPVNQ